MKITYLPQSPGLRTMLPTVYSEMVSRSQNMRNITTRVSSVNWPFMSKQLEKVKNFSDAAK